MNGVDLAKNIFQVHAVDVSGHVVLANAFKPIKFKLWAANLKKCQIGIEACGGAHHWARELKKMAPQFVNHL